MRFTKGNMANLIVTSVTVNLKLSKLLPRPGTFYKPYKVYKVTKSPIIGSKLLQYWLNIALLLNNITLGILERVILCLFVLLCYIKKMKYAHNSNRDFSLLNYLYLRKYLIPLNCFMYKSNCLF